MPFDLPPPLITPERPAFIASAPAIIKPEAWWLGVLPGMIPGAGLIAGAAVGSFETIHDASLSGNTGLVDDVTFRTVIIPDLGSHTTYTKIRVTFKSGAEYNTFNCSVGVRTSDTGRTDTVSTPVELLFNDGNSGFAIVGEQVALASDDLIFSFVSGDSLVCIADGKSGRAAPNSGTDGASFEAGTSYTNATGIATNDGGNLGVDLVEGFGT